MNKTSNSSFNNPPQVPDISGILTSLRDFPSVQTLPHARHISAIVRLWKGTPMSQHPKASGRLFPDSVTDTSADKTLLSPTLECAAKFESTCFPQLDWLLDPDKPRTLLNRVLGQLALAEAKETNPHYKADYRIAWITCKWAADGVYKPHVAATYRVLGVHPNLVWSHVLADRHAKLADEFQDWFDVDGNRKPDVPKKPVTSSAEGSASDRRIGQLSSTKSVEPSADSKIPANGGICIPAGVGAEKMACPVVAAPSVPCPKKKGA